MRMRSLLKIWRDTLKFGEKLSSGPKLEKINPYNFPTNHYHVGFAGLLNPILEPYTSVKPEGHPKFAPHIDRS